MKTISYLIMLVFVFSFANASNEVKEGALKKCVGLLTQDGSVIHKEDCISPTKTVVKKGVYPKVISGPIDTPQKAMELYNKTRNETTTVENENDSSDQ